MVKEKQSQPQQPKGEEGYHSIANEELNEELILHSWRLVKEQVQRVIEFNKSQGVPNPEAYIGYIYDGIKEPMSIHQKRRWLNIIRHKKGGKPITVDSLIGSGRISDIEKEVFGDKAYPRIEISQLFRIKAQDNSEYLMRVMQAVGLSEIGAIVTLPINGDCDFTRKVPISATTGKMADGMEVKILQVGSGEFTYENSPKIYTTPFTKENVLAALEKYPPSEDNDNRGKIAYIFQKEGVPASPIQVTKEEFIDGDFDEVWARRTAPAPQININSRDLSAFVKMDNESKEQHKQYS